MKELPKYYRWLIYLGVTTLLLTIIFLLRLIFTDFIDRFIQALIAIVLPFSIALFISYLLSPVFKLLEQKLKQRYRFLNTILVMAGVAFLLYIIGRFAGGLIYEQGANFIREDWPRVVSALDEFFEDRGFLEALYANIAEVLTWENLNDLDLDLLGVFRSVTNIIITIVLVPVFLFFILNDRQRIYEGILILFPKSVRHHAVELLSRANRVTEQYFNGRFATMFVMAIVFTVVFFILGFRERSLLFGFMLGFFDVVPYVGPFIAMLLPVLYSLTDETLMFGEYAPLAILITVVIGQLIQNNVAQPLIMGRETKLHPLLVLSSFVFFGYLFGVVGIILAIPITGMIRTSVDYAKEVHHNRLKLDKEFKKKIREDVENESH